MDSTFQARSDPKSRTKSASRFSHCEELPHLSIGVLGPSPSTPPAKSPAAVPLHEFLLLSPSPLRRSSNARLADRLEMAEADAAAAAAEPVGSRRRCKSRAAPPGCASPRNARRSLRRRSELELSREEKDLCLGEEAAGKPRKRRPSARSKKEKLSLVPYSPPTLPSSSTSSLPPNEEIQCSLDRIGQLASDLVMWRDVAKSSLWFGIGSLFFFSSCFARGLSFSVFSVISKLGILFLGVSFVSNSIRQRNVEQDSEFRLKEDDILRFARVILPFTNLAMSTTRKIFSGEPAMTLKVTPFLLLGAEYGHLITLWRLSAIGFFLAFTLPKVYSCYSNQITQKVESLKWRALDAWGACSRKKIVAASVVTAFWNLSTVKTRFFTAFILLVLLRYCRQNITANGLDDKEASDREDNNNNNNNEQALTDLPADKVVVD